MSLEAPITVDTWTDRLRERFGERAIAFVLALAIEVLLVLAILSLGMIDDQKNARVSGNVVSVSFDSEKPEPDPAKPAAADLPLALPKPANQQAPRAAAPAEKVPVPVVTPSTAPRPFLELAGGSLDISKLPRQPGPTSAPAKRMGPVDTGTPGDSKRVGTAPGGQPMYAAAWYREPYDDELAGYLSTADGPGWALIACRTAPEWRVEDCVALDEYPNGSNISRAVLAASWQFQVRPPRLGGVYKVGEWVRIRIDYTIRRRG